MSRKVYVTVQVKLIIEMEEGIEVAEVLDEMNYSFISQTGGADIVDTVIVDHEVTDSK